MLDYRPRTSTGAGQYAVSASLVAASEEWLREILRILQRRSRMIILIAGTILALGVIYTLVAARIYTATATILVGSNRVSIMATDLANSMGSTETFVESQVQILQSEAIARRVIAKLELMKDPELNGERPGLVGRVVNSVIDTVDGVIPSFMPLDGLRAGVQPRDLPPEVLERLVMRNLLRNLSVSRPVRTFVIRLSYSSQSPSKAATIANGFAEAFMVDQLEVQYDQTRRAAAWLNERLEEMRGNVEAAERRVEAYRAENNLTAVSGRLLADQQMQELDSQLTVARANVAEARAKLAQIEAIMRSGADPSAMPEALTSQAIAQLKAQFTEVSRNAADLSNRYGAKHPLVLSAIEQQAGIRKLIDEEVQRIAQTYKNQVDVALAREDSLKQTYAELEARNVEGNRAQIKLRELERDAASTRLVFERFLNRFKEMTANENLPIPDARVLAPASFPASADQPKVLLIIAASLGLGLLLGFGAAFTVEQLDAGLRTRSQVEQLFDLPFLTFVPMARGRSQQVMTNFAIEHPLSSYAEAIRSLRMSIRLMSAAEEIKVVAVASALPGEGKSTTAINLAKYAASSGSRTLLIDADMRRPTTTLMMAKAPGTGLREVIQGTSKLADAVINDPRTGLDFLPTVRGNTQANTGELLSSEEFANLVEVCRRSYDLVVIDVSPILPVVDGRAVLNYVDKVVLIVEWNKTSRQVLNEALQLIRMWRESILGVVLNKADMQRIHHYESYNVKSYSSKYPTYYGQSH